MYLVRILSVAVLCLALVHQLVAASVVSISPIHRNLILLRIDDGDITYHQSGQTWNDDILNNDPANLALLQSVATYTIQSAEDPLYQMGRQPVIVHRKSKPVEITGLCDGWEFLPFYEVFGCANEQGDRVMEHWVYLELPDSLREGATYNLTFQAGLNAGPGGSFTFSSTASASESIHVNNLGYSTAATAKYGYVYHWAGDRGGVDFSFLANIEAGFSLINEQTGQAAYNGTLSFRKDEFTQETFQDNPLETPNQNFLQAPVWEADFSAFNEPGLYRLSVMGVGLSNPFEISCQATRPAFEATIRGLYHNRSGIALEPQYTDRPHPADHHPILTPGFADKLRYTTTTLCEVSNPDAAAEDRPLWEAGELGVLTESWGWYHDAGDWDAYPRHLQVPEKLLFTYEHFPDNFTDALNIPESGNGIPDIIDEARWLLRFYKRLKDETESKNWTTGGVPGARIFDDLWRENEPEGGLPAWEENTNLWYVSGEEASFTFYYAAVAAHLGIVLGQGNFSDPEGIDWIEEARSAYDWAITAYDPGNPNCHGDNGTQLYFNAASALYRAGVLYPDQLPNASVYLSTANSLWNLLDIAPDTNFDDVMAFGGYHQLMTVETGNQFLRGEINERVINTANKQLVDNIDGRSCRWGGNFFFPMLSGQPTTPYVFSGLMGYAFTRGNNPDLAANYLASLHTTADYFLGTNPLNMTWISGVGERNPYGILHLNSWYDGGDGPVEGIVPYGPWRRDPELFNVGPWSHHWPDQSVYPTIDVWPGHERWFETRYTVLGGEFTINQNAVNAACIYGALAGNSECTELPLAAQSAPPRPEVMVILFPNPSDGLVQLRSKFGGNLRLNSLSVTSSRGERILAMDAPSNSIDLSGFPAGVYFIQVRHSGGQRQSFRLLLTK